VVQFDRAHFYPEKDLVYLELTVEKGSGRVLGIQGLGTAETGMLARINAVAPLLPYRITTQDISNLELPYAPPFSSAMDILNALGNTAENILSGKNRVIEPDQFALWWDQRASGEVLFLDCREWGNAGPFVEKFPDNWKSIPQGQLRDRLGEVPKDKKGCSMSLLNAESPDLYTTLDQAGIHETFNLQGGMAAVKKWGLDPLG